MGNKGENIGDGGGWSRRFGPTMPHIRSPASTWVRSESPKTRGQEFGGLGRDGGEADQRFPYLILLQFLDFVGDSQVPRSHAFCLPLFVSTVAFLLAFVPALEMSYIDCTEHSAPPWSISESRGGTDWVRQE